MPITKKRSSFNDGLFRESLKLDFNNVPEPYHAFGIIIFLDFPLGHKGSALLASKV